MRRIPLFLSLMLLLAGAVACDPAVRSRPSEQAPVAVRTARAELVEWAEPIEISGTVSSLSTADLAARLVARVLTVSVQEGDRVSAGQLLATLERRELEAALAKVEGASRELDLLGQETDALIQAAQAGLAQAQANARLAEATFRRFEALLAREAVSRQEFDEVRARQEISQAAVTAAQENLRSVEARRQQLAARAAQVEADRTSAQAYLEFSQIRAPFSGVVARRMADPGDLASPAFPLLTIEKTDYRLEAELEESLLGEVRLGNELEVRITSLQEPLTGRVTQIAPSADPRTRSTRVKLSLPAHPGLRSGLFARLRLPGRTASGIVVPREALIERGQLTAVFVVDAQRALFRVVRTGPLQGDRQVILSGLSAGDEVVLGPSTELQDGTPVRLDATGREARS